MEFFYFQEIYIMGQMINNREEFKEVVESYEFSDDLKYVGEWQGYDAYIADTNGNDHLYRMEIYVDENGVLYNDGSLTKDDIERDKQNLEIELDQYKYPYSEFPFELNKFKNWLNKRIDKGIDEGNKNLSNYENDKLNDLEVGMGYVEKDDKLIFKMNIPDWAISYLVNGDASGFEEGQEEEVKEWETYNKVESVNPTDEHDEFNVSPQFGDPCATTVCYVTTRK